MSKSNKYFPEYWLGKDKKKISCKEKIKLIEIFSDSFKYLPEIIYELRSIRNNFLITTHGCIKNDFTASISIFSNGKTFKKSIRIQV